jgi:hypothetical protein
LLKLQNGAPAVHILHAAARSAGACAPPGISLLSFFFIIFNDFFRNRHLNGPLNRTLLITLNEVIE